MFRQKRTFSFTIRLAATGRLEWRFSEQVYLLSDDRFQWPAKMVFGKAKGLFGSGRGIFLASYNKNPDGAERGNVFETTLLGVCPTTACKMA